MVLLFFPVEQEDCNYRGSAVITNVLNCIANVINFVTELILLQHEHAINKAFRLQIT